MLPTATTMAPVRFPAPPRLPTAYTLADAGVPSLGVERDWRETDRPARGPRS